MGVDEVSYSLSRGIVFEAWFLKCNLLFFGVSLEAWVLLVYPQKDTSITNKEQDIRGLLLEAQASGVMFSFLPRLFMKACARMRFPKTKESSHI